MKKIVIALGLVAAVCAFAGCSNKAASDTATPVAAQEMPAPAHDFKGEVDHAK